MLVEFQFRRSVITLDSIKCTHALYELLGMVNGKQHCWTLTNTRYGHFFLASLDRIQEVDTQIPVRTVYKEYLKYKHNLSEQEAETLVEIQKLTIAELEPFSFVLELDQTRI